MRQNLVPMGICLLLLGWRVVLAAEPIMQREYPVYYPLPIDIGIVLFHTCMDECGEGSVQEYGRSYSVCTPSVGDTPCTGWSPLNVIPDFSHAGYMGGGVAIPYVESAYYLHPVEGDNTSHIQGHIDQLAEAIDRGEMDRGAIVLAAGTFEVWDTIHISHSGIVLRGEGESTIIKAMGDGDLEAKDNNNDGKIDDWIGRRRVIDIHGKNDFKRDEHSIREITDRYVPVGAKNFYVSSTDGYTSGDSIVVYRDCNDRWLQVMGTDKLCEENDICSAWRASEYRFQYERKITAIDGNMVTIDVPLTQAIDKEYGGGKIYKYSFGGRISQVGVEDLMIVSRYESDTDEDHAWDGIVIEYTENAWVRRVTGKHLVRGFISIGNGTRHITAEDSKCLEAKSKIRGGRRSQFLFDRGSQMSLFQRCYSEDARHAFITGSRVIGPNVYLDCEAKKTHSDDGPHHRWAHGVLYDNLRTQRLNVVKRKINMSGHGWTGGQIVFWNSTATQEMCIQSPPTSQNYAIGCTAAGSYPRGDNCDAWAAAKGESTGYIESNDERVSPSSLYLHQLSDRLGSDALDNTGWNQYNGCRQGYVDCDGELQNGCESTLDANPHCGSCNTDCSKRMNEKACIKKGSHSTCGCMSDADCQSGYVCINGYCENTHL